MLTSQKKKYHLMKKKAQLKEKKIQSKEKKLFFWDFLFCQNFFTWD